MNEVKEKVGNYRNHILALVFMATTINYFDRSIVGVMAPTLQRLLNWSNKDYAAIMISFKIAYGLANNPIKRFITYNKYKEGLF